MAKSKKNNNSLKITSKNKYCSAKNKSNGSNYTCFTKDTLVKIAKNINKHKKHNKIKISSNKKKLWSDIKRNFNECKHEWCWINQRELAGLNNELRINFRPEMPSEWYKDDREWLSTIDIEDAMEQYEDRNFWFVGAVPIDFNSPHSMGGCVVDELCNIDIKQIYKQHKIKKIGIIFNLDKHDEPGSHWVSMYCDIPGKKVLYYDSYGYKPQSEIDKFIKILKNQINELFKCNDTEVKYNNVRHQFKDSECGIYSMLFILNMLNGKDFNNYITRTKLDDDSVHKNRARWWIPSRKLI